MALPTKTRCARLSFAMRRRRLLAAAAAAIVGGCAPLPRDDRGPLRPEPPRPRIVARLYYRDDPNLVRIERAGRAIAVSNGMELFAGDIVETMSSHAEIRFPPSDQVWLDVNTRVRVSSLWLYFGRIFASVSPPFSVETEDFTASPEGTRFSVQRKRETREFAVVVETGQVRCTGRLVNFQFTVRAGSVLSAPSRLKPQPPRQISQVELKREIDWASRAILLQKPERTVPLHVPPTPGAGTPR
ncbi:MAG: FecR family protein [Gammaproteobacteria bacterium]